MPLAATAACHAPRGLPSRRVVRLAAAGAGVLNAVTAGRKGGQDRGRLVKLRQIGVGTRGSGMRAEERVRGRSGI